MRYFSTFIVLFFCLSLSSFSQGQKPYGEFSSPATKKTEKMLLKAARKEFDFGNYDLAAAKYTELLKIDSTNPMYNFEQAQTFFNNYRQTESIKYYEKAIRYSKDSLGEAYYFLASAYHLDGQYDKAQENYITYLKIFTYHGTLDLLDEEEAEVKDEIKHKMEMCENGKSLSKLPSVEKFKMNGKTRTFHIENVGKEVNSEYDDYGVVLSPNDSLMYFTTRREGTTGGKVDWDDKFFEDIYTSPFGKSGWGTCTPISAPVNTKKHEAVISVSPDGKTLYFYRGIKQGTFFYSKQEGTSWTKPEVLYEKSDMNTNSWETSFFGFTVVGSELYVVSDREGGMGGRDIYVSKKQADGSWGPLENMGAPINTKYDEDAPFITSDGKTMYFSSKGHNSIGGFDIFKSEKDADKWSEPANLGLPFNTPGEDIYFIIANKTDRAYYSSSSLNPDGTKDMDIYMIDFCDDIEDMILAGATFGITSGSVSIAEKESGQKIGDYTIENGKYSVRLKHGKNYRFTFNVGADKEPVSADIAIPRLCKVHDVYQELNLSQTELLVKNAFFDIKKDAGVANYSDFLNKIDKANTLLYSEISLPISVAVLATATIVSTPTTVATASTSTVSSTTTTTATTTATSSTTTGTSTATTISVSNVLFDYDKSTMSGEFAAELDKVVAFLKGSKNAKIDIAGFTDAKGSDEYNMALSKRRAEAVAAYLVSKGISRSRITATGRGESKPLAANENPDGSDNPEGRAKNRRTEITVTQ